MNNMHLLCLLSQRHIIAASYIYSKTYREKYYVQREEKPFNVSLPVSCSYLSFLLSWTMFISL